MNGAARRPVQAPHRGCVCDVWPPRRAARGATRRPTVAGLCNPSAGSGGHLRRSAAGARSALLAVASRRYALPWVAPSGGGPDGAAC